VRGTSSPTRRAPAAPASGLSLPVRIATHHDRDVARADIFLADEDDVSCFTWPRGFNGAYQAFGFIIPSASFSL